MTGGVGPDEHHLQRFGRILRGQHDVPFFTGVVEDHRVVEVANCLCRIDDGFKVHTTPSLLGVKAMSERAAVCVVKTSEVECNRQERGLHQRRTRVADVPGQASVVFHENSNTTGDLR